MKWVFQTTLAVLLSCGWLWVNLLKDSGLVTEPQRVLALTLLTACLIGQHFLVSKPRPANRRQVRDREQVAQNNLASLWRAYFDLPGVDKTKGNFDVRINIMVPRQGFLGKQLEMIYFYCPAGLDYTNEEKSLLWSKGIGTVGTSWKTGKDTVYDSKNTKFKGPLERLSDIEREIVQDVGSVLSVPVVGATGKVVGILSLDSTANIDKTKFSNLETINLATSYANNLEPILFPNGIAKA